jgi:predicted negative regulator of RcsB-dependent stress response
VGTTKLTRKEILAEDPIHEAILRLIEFVKENGNKIGIAAAVVVLLGAGIYGGLYYLENREMQTQAQLGKGMDFFHAEVVQDAKDDPYGKGPTPTFRSETAKYQAAAKEFEAIASRQSYSKLAVVARYYLGLCQFRLGRNKEAIQNLESVANNSRERTIGFLAKKNLATNYFNAGNYQGAQGILDGMIKDPKCDLPKEDLSLQLSRALVAQGKRDQAIKILSEANSQGAEFGIFKQKLAAELDKLQRASKTGSAPNPARP